MFYSHPKSFVLRECTRKNGLYAIAIFLRMIVDQ
jgi:hypothetical protein